MGPAVLARVGRWLCWRGLVDAAACWCRVLVPVPELGGLDDYVPLAIHRLCSSDHLWRFLYGSLLREDELVAGWRGALLRWGWPVGIGMLALPI